jgi:hypothetical protein
VREPEVPVIVREYWPGGVLVEVPLLPPQPITVPAVTARRAIRPRQRAQFLRVFREVNPNPQIMNSEAAEIVS